MSQKNVLNSPWTWTYFNLLGKAFSLINRGLASWIDKWLYGTFMRNASSHNDYRSKKVYISLLYWIGDSNFERDTFQFVGGRSKK